ncbi:uncharacterized protein LOC133182202 [Saccostrea echinata]|uniref:uncharacterized protein LOC133182202 n=1 Tax=Saccostrea echinata TaxID=191078 RepID=UPI002A7FDD17|nr:uncharacterized protein LOC133182202 [Saccostrea echinata]
MANSVKYVRMSLLKFANRANFIVPMRHMSRSADKKQHLEFTRKRVDDMMKRMERERRESQTLNHEGYELDPVEGIIETFEHERYENRRTKKSIFCRKYEKSTPEPSFLTWQAKQQIIYLCTKENWSFQEIAESFPISAENVRKLLRHRNRTLTPSEITKHDKKILKKWQHLLVAGYKIGRGPIDPELKQMVETERIKLLHNAGGIENLPVPVSKPSREQEDNHLDFYTFHYIDKGRKENRYVSRFQGQFLKLYRIYHDQQSQSPDTTVQMHGVIEKEAEKLKLLQALVKNYRNEEKSERNESDDFPSSSQENDKIEADSEIFQNEWFVASENVQNIK